MMTPDALYARLSSHGFDACDIHTHTTFCDGKNTPLEMTEAAILKGMKCLGFSGHAHTAFDESSCMSEEGTKQYRAEIMSLKERYKGTIDILLGIEQDLYSDDTPADFDYDYTIGSVHYLHTPDGGYPSVDDSPAQFQETCALFYDGDYLLMAEDYFKSVAELASLPIPPTVIGHIDLISKFNRDGALFDESSPRYLAAAYAAVDALIPTGALFEINTGVIVRGWRNRPYPALKIQEYIADRGGRFILTGDTHRAENLCSNFECFIDRI